MNQKNYMLLFSSLLMVSVLNMNTMGKVEEDFDESPIEDQSTMSPDESNNSQWAQKYGEKIAKDFSKIGVYSISEADLNDYEQHHAEIPEKAFKEVDIAYMLGVVNGFLHKELKALKHEKMFERVINSFVNDNDLKKINNFSNIIVRAARLFGAESTYINKLKKLSETDKNILIDRINKALSSNQRKISRALLLSREIEKENKRQGRGFEDRKRRQRRDEVAQTAAALDLAFAVNNKTLEASEHEEITGHDFVPSVKERTARALDLAAVVSSKNKPEEDDNEGMRAPQNTAVDDLGKDTSKRTNVWFKKKKSNNKPSIWSMRSKKDNEGTSVPLMTKESVSVGGAEEIGALEDGF